MAVERFLPDVQRTRRIVGFCLGIPAGGLLLFIVARVIENRYLHPDPTGLVVLAILAAMTALGVYLAFMPSVVFEVDPEARHFNLIRRGTQPEGSSLDSLAPLSIEMRTTVSGPPGKQRHHTVYVVSAATHSSIDLYTANTPGRARQKMERLGRAWGLACQSFGGEVRGANDLDTPLHERLRGDAEARRPMSIPPGSAVHIEDLSPGFAVVSSFRDWKPFLTGLFFLAIACYPFYGMRHVRDWSSLAAGDTESRALLGVMLLFGLLVSGRALLLVRDTFFPGTVRVTPEGVRYRSRHMPFAAIEEITASEPIEIVGDRRIIALAVSFCPYKARTAVTHEIRRLIIEVGSQSS